MIDEAKLKKVCTNIKEENKEKLRTLLLNNASERIRCTLKKTSWNSSPSLLTLSLLDKPTIFTKEIYLSDEPSLYGFMRSNARIKSFEMKDNNNHVWNFIETFMKQSPFPWVIAGGFPLAAWHDFNIDQGDVDLFTYVPYVDSHLYCNLILNLIRSMCESNPHLKCPHTDIEEECCSYTFNIVGVRKVFRVVDRKKPWKKLIDFVILTDVEFNQFFSDSYISTLKNPITLGKKVSERFDLNICKVIAFKSDWMSQGKWMLVNLAPMTLSVSPTQSHSFFTKMKPLLNRRKRGKKKINQYFNPINAEKIKKEINFNNTRLIKYLKRFANSKKPLSFELPGLSAVNFFENKLLC